MRPFCEGCQRALSVCYCPLVRPFESGPLVVVLRHPRERRSRSRVNTGWLTHRVVSNSVLLEGLDFEREARVQAWLSDPSLAPVLVFPSGDGAPGGDESAAVPAGRRPLLFLPDGTWTCVRHMLLRNPQLARLPRLSLRAGPSRYTFRRQP
ncbi:MAG: tRNA-uridine aminocarboxypropyltransferase, partial [Candidatus Eremiobacterota bacterium]